MLQCPPARSPVTGVGISTSSALEHNHASTPRGHARAEHSRPGRPEHSRLRRGMVSATTHGRRRLPLQSRPLLHLVDRVVRVSPTSCGMASRTPRRDSLSTRAAAQRGVVCPAATVRSLCRVGSVPGQRLGAATSGGDIEHGEIELGPVERQAGGAASEPGPERRVGDSPGDSSQGAVTGFGAASKTATARDTAGDSVASETATARDTAGDSPYCAAGAGETTSAASNSKAPTSAARKETTATATSNQPELEAGSISDCRFDLDGGSFVVRRLCLDVLRSLRFYAPRLPTRGGQPRNGRYPSTPCHGMDLGQHGEGQNRAWRGTGSCMARNRIVHGSRGSAPFRCLGWLCPEAARLDITRLQSWSPVPGQLTRRQLRV